jgi:DNA-binding transcriptional regulator GbsR (MarR family)
MKYWVYIKSQFLFYINGTKYFNYHDDLWKIISNIFKCKIQKVDKIKLNIMQLERLDEIVKSDQDFEMIKFYLDDINDFDKKN